jgi:hypothetical protein
MAARPHDTDIDRRLLPDEHVVDDVRHVWVVFLGPALLLLGAVVLGLWALVVVPIDSLWLPLITSAVLLGFSSDRIARAWKDRLIITDSRVMRVSGVYSRKAAWMPLSRVLDITVDRPLWLRPLRAGHLTLENAAQEQGLREFRFIPHPNERALRIHALRTGVASPGPSAEPPRPVVGSGRRPDHPARRGGRRDGHHLA